MSDNHIKNISSEDFANCTNVFKVDLDRQQVSSISGFCHLPKSLEIYIGPLWDIYMNQSCIEDFSNLAELTLTPTTGKVTNMTFKPLRNLPIKRLRLEGAYFDLMDEYVLSWFPQLISIDIEASISIPFVRVIPSYKAWDGLKHSKLLKKIRFSFSTRNVAVNDSCKWMPPVTIFDSTFAKSLACCPNVEELQLDDTNAIDVKDLCYKSVNLSKNYFDIFNIYTVIGHFYNCKKLTALDLSYQINTGGENYDSLDLFYLPENLAILDMSYFSIKFTNDMRNFSFGIYRSWKLKHFSFRGNSVSVLSRFSILQNNTEVEFTADLSRNKMVTLYPDAFRESVGSGLRFGGLLLSENKLGDQLGKSDQQIFKLLRHLRVLDLSFNDIKNLPYGAFKNNANLGILNLSRLSSNFLLTIQFQFSHMTNLQILDLSNNLISQFNSDLQTTFNDLKLKSPNLTIHLSGNPFQCSCDYRHFLQWIHAKHEMFPRIEEYSCLYGNKISNFSRMEEMLSDLQYKCSLDLIVKVSGGVLALLIVVVALSIFLYRHKWDIRFFCIKFVARKNAYVEQEGYQHMFEYDAFVAYHKNDLKWVTDELFKNLDEEALGDDLSGQTRFRLCFHDRDFIPGTSIEDNIVRAIENSRKTILVLSKDFLTSGWCDFELQMARMESFDKGRNVIVVVMLEPLPMESMKKSLKLLIQRNTYIEWFKDGMVDKSNFWEKMRVALGSQEFDSSD